jgi:hypothetical protein
LSRCAFRRGFSAAAPGTRESWIYGPGSIVPRPTKLRTFQGAPRRGAACLVVGRNRNVSKCLPSINKSDFSLEIGSRAPERAQVCKRELCKSITKVYFFASFAHLNHHSRAANGPPTADQATPSKGVGQGLLAACFDANALHHGCKGPFWTLDMCKRLKYLAKVHKIAAKVAFAENVDRPE